jgi:catechol 2,3-dioxygenase-like lactoylglutathione lyase family enzyme
MSIRRAIPNVLSDDLEASQSFYEGLLGFRLAMEQEGLKLFASPSTPTTQVIVAARDSPAFDPAVPRSQMSVEVADVDAVHAEARRRGLDIVYPLTDEPWGIRRFFVRDPDGTVVNVTSHIAG